MTQESFAPNPAAVRIERGGVTLVIDEETGEILDWPGVPEDARLEVLQGMHVESAEQEAQWKAAKDAQARAIGALLDERGDRSYAGQRYRSWAVLPTILETAPAERVADALAAEIIDHGRLELLRANAVREYDAKAIRALQAAGELSARQADALVKRHERRGYVRTEPLRMLAPKVTRKART